MKLNEVKVKETLEFIKKELEYAYGTLSDSLRDEAIQKSIARIDTLLTLIEFE